MFKGKITCANVLSDLYAMGVTDCDNMLMLLAVSSKMSEKERDVVIPMIMRGFKVKINDHITYHTFIHLPATNWHTRQQFIGWQNYRPVQNENKLKKLQKVNHEINNERKAVLYCNMSCYDKQMNV